MREREADGRGTDWAGWPMLGAFVETAVDDRLVLTFALSDVLPAGRVEAVTLGVDALRDGAGRRVTLYAVFEPQSVNVFSRCGDLERRHDDAEVTYPDGAVCVTLDLAEPALCLDSQPEVRGFAVIDGVTRQEHAPVTLLPA
ncbi:hypothetical protein [Herbiconiux sp. VKM Ac-2851]|uniref:hypothetical protein n=1 Tax=Herbiconiux sp. VKM Ac-2851 TaxID=2739025 RepID=UPI0015676AA1|nr:hypothetical protein [Herbiconiux sp. VKM Ac-2851]NQX35744.1 hypothetical protein [Herbiconiux sp. VKM Ac-2851]